MQNMILLEESSGFLTYIGGGEGLGMVAIQWPAIRFGCRMTQFLVTMKEAKYLVVVHRMDQ